jgi:hypothetical protein
MAIATNGYVVLSTLIEEEARYDQHMHLRHLGFVRGLLIEFYQEMERQGTCR